MRTVTVVLGLFCMATAVHAQERLTDLGLPREAQRRINLIIDDPATRRFDGNSRLSSADTIEGNVVVLEGSLIMSGRIDGELIVIGDVEFTEGSSITGDLTVVGGEARALELADIGGTVTLYGEGFELFHRGERILAVNTRHRRGRYLAYEDWGRSTFSVRPGIYNRVEGLPIALGPVIETSGRSPTRFEAVGILRTGAGDPFDTDHFGYQVRLEQYIGGHRFRIGGVARSVIEPIESWNLTNLEASLATFLLHDDQRDYFDREGWGAYVRYGARRTPLDVSIGYWDEEHGARAARDPWTLFGDGDWRAQPLVASGRLQSLQGRIQFDTRNSRDFAATGFYIAADAMHGLSGSLAIPGSALTFDSTAIITPALPINEHFTSGLLDVRIYRPVGSGGALALRGVAGGSLDGEGLPPQFQHALGGSGSLPGYGLFQADCGARTVTVIPEGRQTNFFPYYGCDRFAMGSVEYRGGFNLDFGGDFDFWGHRDEDWGWNVDASPNWMVFFDAARGWALGDSRKLGATDTGILYDAGAGVMLGGFGFYAAVPLNGDDHGVNFFIRLGARF